MRLRRRLRVAVRDAALLGDPVHDLLVAVGVVGRDHPLQDRRGPLEAHAGVDVLLRKRRDRAVVVQLVLHEDEVPELEEAFALAARRTGRATAPDLLAAVVEELGVRPAGARAADRPEVVRAVEPDDALRGQALRLPEAHRLLVLAEPELRIAGKDGHPELVGIDLHVIEDELPGEVDRALLEVLTEREVAEHLEEGQVERVEPDLVDIRGAEDLLDGRQERSRGRLAAEEVRHERLHARAVEQRRPVPVRRDERAGRVPLVTLRLEEREEALSELGARAHASDCTSRTFGALVSHTCATFGITIAAGRRWTVPYPKAPLSRRRASSAPAPRHLRPRSPRGSALGRGESVVTRASARSRPAARSATGSAP